MPDSEGHAGGAAAGQSAKTNPNSTGESARRSIARSAGIVSGAVMLSRILGLAREIVFTGLFGASKSIANDAFVMAFRIPNLLRDLFAEGALSGAFVTVFSDYQVTRSEKEAFRLSNLVTTLLIVVLGTLVVLGIIFAPQIVSLIASGYRDDPEKFNLTVDLTRIMMPFILLVALAAQAMGILNARDKFGIPALSSSFFNIGSLGGGLFFAVLLADPTFSDPWGRVLEHPERGIIGMSYGVLIGGFLQYAVQWPSLRRAGFRYRPMLSLNDPGIRRILRLMGPAVIGGAAVQVNIFVNSNFASTIPGDGAVKWLDCAFRFMQFPIGVFGVAIATATLPAISRSAALSETGEFRTTLAGSIRLALLLTVPSAVGLIVLAHPIISLIYEWGNFTSLDAAHTAATLAYYAIGLSGYSAVKILVPAFFALRDARTPMVISLISIFTNFVMNWALVRVLQERGLALSVSVVAMLNFVMLYVMMRRRLGRIDGKQTASVVSRILIAAGVMAVAVWFVSRGISSAAAGLGSEFAGKLVVVVASVAAGAVTFYLVASLLRIPELRIATRAIAGRLARR
jgi:putative peptidoglycan lipid II flippase